MKRFCTYALSILGTLLLLGAGAFMPQLAALATDSRLEREVVVRQEAQTTLKMSADFFKTLASFGLKQSQVLLGEGRQMGAKEAQNTALGILQELSAAGMVYTAPQVAPVLLTGQEAPGQPGIFWRCVWGEPGLQETMWLDDESGRMVAFEGRMMADTTLERTIEPDYAYKIVYPDMVLAVAEYCRRHYPADTTKLALLPGTIHQQEPQEFQEVAFTDYLVTLQRERDGREESCNILLRTRGQWLYFNT